MSKIEVNAVEPQCGTTLTLGASGDTVDLSNASVTLPSGIQAVSWQTGSIKTSGFTAAAGEGYFCNTSSSAFTVTLPSGSAGAVVAVSDYTRTFQTNNLTISPQSGEKIGGVAADATLSTEGQTATFVYVDSTEGWINVQETSNSVTGEAFITATGGTITTSGNYKIHTFTGPGTFCVSQIATTPANNEVSYLVVAGGGGAGDGNNGPNRNGGGGGGAGGYRESKSGVDCYSASPLEGSTNISVTATAFPITVGSGGSGGYSGGVGNNSVFSTITSAGGGNGTSDEGSGAAGNGGSGGGAGNNGSPGGAGSPVAGGSGNTPPVSPPQGNDGSQSPGLHGGGGGGAINAAALTINGGGGATTSITASPVAYAGGGGAGSPPSEGSGGSGGPGGGGDGGDGSGPISGAGTAGTANTGGGGGGGDSGPTGTAAGGNGGSGIVIIRYKYQ
jgi:hypothetical protein